MREHPNAAVVRRSYEALDQRDGAGDVRTPLAFAAVGDLVVAIDARCGSAASGEPHGSGVAVFLIEDGRIVDVRRVAPRR